MVEKKRKGNKVTNQFAGYSGMGGGKPGGGSGLLGRVGKG